MPRNLWKAWAVWLLMLAGSPLQSIAATAEAAAVRPQIGACMKDICAEPVKTIAGQQVSLTGLQLFTYWGFELYTAALYLPQAAPRSIEGALSDVPKSLLLIYRRKIRSDQIIKAGGHNLVKNPSNDMPALQERLDQLNAAYQTVQKGDRYELLYEPGRGTTLLFNDKPLVTLPGVDFQKAYFGIWLSDYPLNAKLRDGLLGKKS